MSSGLKSVAKGTAAGVASLIAQPVVGAKQGGKPDNTLAVCNSFRFISRGKAELTIVSFDLRAMFLDDR